MTPENGFKTPTKTNSTVLKCMPYFDDHDDRKTLDALIEKLFNSPKTLNKKSPNCKQSTSKSVTEYSENVNNSEESVRKKPKNTYTLNGWISKSTNKSKWCKSESKGTGKMHGKKQTESAPGTKTPAKLKKRQFKRNSSGSFDKYGVWLPSFDDIVASQKKYDDHKECVDKFNKMESSHDSLVLNIDEPSLPGIILDCKHLSKKELQDAFYRNYKYIYDIYHGFRPSLRHDQFKKESHKDRFTIKDLKYNTSMTTFTFEQKQEMLACLHKEFSEEGLCQNNQYFFKVLLPELCTKIFMDVHHMGYEEATTYLEEQPVEDSSAI